METNREKIQRAKARRSVAKSMQLGGGVIFWACAFVVVYLDSHVAEAFALAAMAMGQSCWIVGRNNDDASAE